MASKDRKLDVARGRIALLDKDEQDRIAPYIENRAGFKTMLREFGRTSDTGSRADIIIDFVANKQPDLGSLFRDAYDFEINAFGEQLLRRNPDITRATRSVQESISEASDLAEMDLAEDAQLDQPRGLKYPKGSYNKYTENEIKILDGLAKKKVKPTQAYKIYVSRRITDIRSIHTFFSFKNKYYRLRRKKDIIF